VLQFTRVPGVVLAWYQLIGGLSAGIGGSTLAVVALHRLAGGGGGYGEKWNRRLRACAAPW